MQLHCSISLTNSRTQAVVGGVVGESGEETVIHVNYNAVFTYVAQAIQELHEVVKATAATHIGAKATVGLILINWIIMYLFASSVQIALLFTTNPQ